MVHRNNKSAQGARRRAIKTGARFRAHGAGLNNQKTRLKKKKITAINIGHKALGSRYKAQGNKNRCTAQGPRRRVKKAI